MRLLVGIDDTDNKDSRGTGYNSRQLAKAIEEEGIGEVVGITRHQLFVHPDIPYTSQNSSACLEVIADNKMEVEAFSKDFMLDVAADGSDVGLCITEYENIHEDVLNWGNNAKSIVLKKHNAVEIAKRNKIFLVGLTGTHDGIIGALAAVGLRKGGDDGRFIWINSTKNLRDIEMRIHSINVIKSIAGIDIVQNSDTEVIELSDRVFLNNWARPILRNNKSVLLVDKILNNKDYEWKCSAKELVKRVSN